MPKSDEEVAEALTAAVFDRATPAYDRVVDLVVVALRIGRMRQDQFDCNPEKVDLEKRICAVNNRRR
jgi:hypothetical protein